MKMSAPNPACMKSSDDDAEFTPGVKEVEVCGGETEKLISKGDFHLKGGGWYKDGY